jgi:hypothetical protein
MFRTRALRSAALHERVFAMQPLPDGDLLLKSKEPYVERIARMSEPGSRSFRLALSPPVCDRLQVFAR